MESEEFWLLVRQVHTSLIPSDVSIPELWSILENVAPKRLGFYSAMTLQVLSLQLGCKIAVCL